jgi:hypothetical protein
VFFLIINSQHDSRLFRQSNQIFPHRLPLEYTATLGYPRISLKLYIPKYFPRIPAICQLDEGKVERPGAFTEKTIQIGKGLCFCFR